jgi:hypothetical protein
MKDKAIISLLLLTVCLTIVTIIVAPLTSALDTNNCVCHTGTSETFGFLVDNPSNVIPSTLGVGESANVTVVLENNVTGATKNDVLTGVTANLISVNGYFSVSTPTLSLPEINGTGNVMATWTITGVTEGEDSIKMTATAKNNHQNISFNDTYTPYPTIMITAAVPSPTPTPTATPTPTTTPTPTPTPTPTATPTPSPEPQGIPGYPYLSIILGALIGITILWTRLHKRNSD